MRNSYQHVVSFKNRKYFPRSGFFFRLALKKRRYLTTNILAFFGKIFLTVFCNFLFIGVTEGKFIIQILKTFLVLACPD